MKHIENHFYLYCVRCGHDWNVSEETFRKNGPYICMLCRKVIRAREKRKKRDDEQKQN